MSNPRIVAVILALLAACASLTAPPEAERPREYVDVGRGYRLTIPAGWTDAPRGTDADEIARFGAIDSKAVLSIHVAPLGSSGCRVAIEEWLPRTKAAAFVTTVDRTMRIASGEVPTVRGEIETLDAGKTGELSAFCKDGSAVIAVGFALPSRRAELAAAAGSFRHVAPAPEPKPTAVKKPTSKRKPPPPRPTRAPKAKTTPVAEPKTRPTEAPEPTAAPTAAPADEGGDEILGPR